MRTQITTRFASRLAMLVGAFALAVAAPTAMANGGHGGGYHGGGGGWHGGGGYHGGGGGWHGGGGYHGGGGWHGGHHGGGWVAGALTAGIVGGLIYSATTPNTVVYDTPSPVYYPSYPSYSTYPAYAPPVVVAPGYTTYYPGTVVRGPVVYHAW